MENPHKIVVSIGKSSINGVLSVAMLDYQRVYYYSFGLRGNTQAQNPAHCCGEKKKLRVQPIARGPKTSNVGKKHLKHKQ